MTLVRSGQHAAVQSFPEIDSSAVQVADPALPAYLIRYYSWAYLRPAAFRIFDHNWIVSAILWGNYGRLKRACFGQLRRGQRVLQAACVYGDFSAALALHLGAEGALDVIDVVPRQVRNCQQKLKNHPWANARIANAHAPGGGASADGSYDAVVSFFLLHELPDDEKCRVVDALLDAAGPDGKAVFVDYHRPRWWHPAGPWTALVFRFLEPFARAMWRTEVRSMASRRDAFCWHKQTLFGGLFQVVSAEPRQRVAGQKSDQLSNSGSQETRA